MSGFRREEMGSLLELTAGGREPLLLRDGQPRGYLADGDTVTLSGPRPARAARGSSSAARPAGSPRRRITPAAG